jgi:hypothetical protein
MRIIGCDLHARQQSVAMLSQSDRSLCRRLMKGQNGVLFLLHKRQPLLSDIVVR